MTDTKLRPLLKELTFWLMLAMSLPGIAAVYIAAYSGVTTGSFDPAAFQSAFLALPIVAYLLTRQYPRGKSIEAAPLMEQRLVILPEEDEIVPPDDEFAPILPTFAEDAKDQTAEAHDAEGEQA